MMRWRRPRLSIRLRLAALLAALFILLGGALLGVSYALVRSNLEGHPRQAETSGPRTGTAHSGEGNHRRVVSRAATIQEQFVEDALDELTAQYLVIMVAMAALSGVLGWFVAGRVLRPMSEISATAQRVSRESLHERIALAGPDDELKRLADTFDSMLARLEAGFDRERAFVSNASHELRTPLSVIRTEADVTLADEADDPVALRRALAVVRKASERSERLIGALLSLARTDRSDHPPSEVDLSQLVREVLDEADAGALRLKLALRQAPVRGDRELLRTMAANLVDNAIRHNLTAGWIEIGTNSCGEEASLEISNSGTVISAAEAASLTEPFRLRATARTGDGLGLGLSITASVAQAHGGKLDIEPLERGGLRVSIVLPTASEQRINRAVGPDSDHAEGR